MVEVSLAEGLNSSELFTDGDWIESKDQDPKGDVRIIQLADIGDRKYRDRSRRFMTSTKAKELGCTYLSPGDILLARMPEPLGRACIFPGDEKPAVTAVDVCIIRPDPDRFDSHWLLQFLNNPTARRQIDSYVTGTTRQRISRKNLGKINVDIPPLDEQRRIAAILDKADELRAKRREAIAKLDTLARSIFIDTFGDPVTNPMGHRVETLASAFNFKTGKLDSNAAVVGGRYPFFTCARQTFAINDYAFDCEALLLAGNNAQGDYSLKHYKGKFNAYQRTYVITVNEAKLTYEYSKMAVEYLLTDLKRYSKGTNTKYLTMKILNEMPILIPRLDDQRRFSSIIRFLGQQQDNNSSILAKQRNLFSSLQHRAFAGEL